MKKGITIIAVAFAVVAAILGAFCVRNIIKSNREFVADGYILDPSKEEFVTNGVDKQYFFSKGDTYREKLGTQIIFKQDSEDANISKEHFIHYNDGSMGAFTKGVILDVSDLDQSNYAYYSLTKNTILVKNNSSYELSTKGDSLALSEYVWKISDTDYMLVSPNVTLQIGNQTVDFPDYAQISYVDNGIVRISHVSGTYQTISADSKLITSSGAELSLVGKSFTAGDGSIISLDDLALGDDSYIKVDENVEDAPHIPTFNVINGKDGANGTNGTNGEDGEEGEEGKEGEEGEIGEDGSEGQQGAEGVEGVQGDDGVEGESGPMGYDGEAGETGKDAVNAGGASSLASAQLNIKPIVSMISDSTAEALGEEYYVDSGSARMTLQLEDPDSSLVPGNTKVYLYDKETMALAEGYDENKAIANGQALASNPNGASMSFNGLNPDKEYLVVVKGDYDITDNYPLEGATLFSKVFKTDALGVEISPVEITDSKICFETKVTDERIDRYGVNVYDESNGVKTLYATYSINKGASVCDGIKVTLDGKNATYVLNGAGDSGVTGGKENSQLDYVIESDHTYYAEIVNVTVESKLVNSGDALLEMHTLKAQPYDKEYFDTNATKKYVPQMSAVLEKNEKNRTLSLSLAKLSDPDYGITGYKYELYEYNADTQAAIDNNDYSGLTPKYVKEAQEQITHPFAIPDTEMGPDGSKYVGRVVVMFNDGQKDMELCSLGSEPMSLSASNEELLVEIIVTNATKTSDAATSAHHDMITGKIKVTNGGILTWDNNHPITLSATNDYKDINDFVFYPQDVGISQTDIDSGNYEIPFTYNGLRADTIHTLTAYGAVDTDGDGHLSDVENNTYLAGKRVSTTDLMPLSLMGAPPQSSPNAAFSMMLTLASPTKDQVYNSSNVDAVSRAYTEYETKVLDSMTLTLWRVEVQENGDNIEHKMGTTTLNNLSTAADKEKNSTFADNYVDRASVANNVRKVSYTPKYSTTGIDIDAIELPDHYQDGNSYIVGPNNFGLPDNFADFYTGDLFKITVDKAVDYTGFNNIPFEDGEDSIAFSIQKKHVQANDPNKQVTITLLDNKSAEDTVGHQEGIDDETIVGIKFRAEYPYTDINKIKYHVYEIVDDTITTSALNQQLLYSTDSTKIKEVLTAEKVEGQSGGFRSNNITLYFNGAQSDVEWHANEGSVENAIKRGKRYIVSYEITEIEDHGSMNCPGGIVGYPQCAYASGENVPLYRSQVIELDKQKPMIERYQISSDDTTETWNYRFVDPDNAIVKNTDGTVSINEKIFASITNYDKGTVAGSNEIKASTDNTWNSVEFKSLTNNYFFTASVKYKLRESAEPVDITSKPVQHKMTTVEPAAYSDSNKNGIRVQGLVAGDSVPTENRVTIGTKTYEKAIVNEGGFRYKITFRGKELYNYSAVRVEVKATKKTDGSTCSEPVIYYDPVPFTGMNTVTEDGQQEVYAYAYLDTAPMQKLLDEDIAEAQISIKGYYNTNTYGFGDYTAKHKTDDYNEWDSLKDENLYALKTMNTTAYDKNQYRLVTLFDNKKKLDTSYEYLVGSASTYSNFNSLFVPGLGTNDNDGLVINAGNANIAANASLRQLYPYSPMSVVNMDDSSQYVLDDLIVDETGLFDATNGLYFSVSKLALSNNNMKLRDGDDSSTIKLSDLMPAVQQSGKISEGATSAKIKMEVIGDMTQIVASDTKPYIYAKILDSAGHYLSVTRETMDIDGNIQYYYQVDTDTYINNDQYATDTYKGYGIPVTENSGKHIAELSIKGLKLDSNYSVVFFAYNQEGNPVELYSVDGKKVGHHYPIKTLKSVSIELLDPIFTADDYSNKRVSLNYGIPGDEGTNIDIWYQLDGGQYLKAEPLGTTVTYYSQDPAVNNPITFNAGPGNWTFNTSRNIKVIAVEKGTESITSSTVILGTASKDCNVTSIDPVFITSSYQDNASHTVGVDIIANDTRREIVDNEFTVILKKDGDDTTLDSKKINLTSSTYSGRVAFDIGEATGKYIVEIVADIDTDNDGNVDKDDEILSTAIIETSDIPSAVISGTGIKNQSNINVSFTNLQNFDKVKKINITIYTNTGNFATVYSGVQDVTDISSGLSYTLIANTALAPGSYSINVQYRDENDKSLGNQSGEFRVD